MAKINKVVLKDKVANVGVYIPRSLLNKSANSLFTPADKVAKNITKSGHLTRRTGYNIRSNAKTGQHTGIYVRKGQVYRIRKQQDMPNFVAVTLLGRAVDVLSKNSVILPRGIKLEMLA